MIKIITAAAIVLSLVGCNANKDNYGSTHGLIVAGSMAGAYYGAKKALPSYPKTAKAIGIGVGVLAAGHFYKREKTARGGADFDTWYTDSQYDAAVPAAVAGAGTLLILKDK